MVLKTLFFFILVMKQYLDHLRAILSHPAAGYKRGERTGVDTISLFGYQNRYNLSEGFPLLTTKKIFIKGITEELLWFLRGETNVDSLRKRGVNFWDPWADEHGNLGPIYGYQWRKWEAFDYDEASGSYRKRHIDQIAETIETIKKNPNSRRLIISAWNVADIPKMALAPCHLLFQFNVQDGRLDCQMYQRSADMFLGVPFNIASYSMLTMLLAQETWLKPGWFVHTFGDSHLYCGAGERGGFYIKNLPLLKEKVSKVEKPEQYTEIASWISETAPPENSQEQLRDHVPLVLLQLSREPRVLPQLEIAQKPLEQMVYEDFILKNYNPHQHIKGAIAV